MLNALLIEDGKDFELIVRAALNTRYNVVCANTVSRARSALAAFEFAIVILDVGLPDGDGFEFCAELQSSPKTKELPVVLLTGKSSPNDKVLGWHAGADDYIEKPFHVFEFQARIDAHVRKHRNHLDGNEITSCGRLHLNLAYQEAKVVGDEGDRLLELTRSEFKLLYHLIKNQGRIVSRSQLQRAAWGPLTNVTDRTIDKHISHLRQKMGPEAVGIETVSGMGYRFARASVLK